MALIAFLTAVPDALPESNDILERVSAVTARRRAVEYSGQRRYQVHNLRFSKSATVTVRVTFRPGAGKSYTIIDRSGSERLIGIVEKMLATEMESSEAEPHKHHEIRPENYHARVRGMEHVDGHECYVLELTPKHKSKYLISGTVWVDKETYGMVRIEGTTASGVSIWIGSPQITQSFAPVDGIWLPYHMKSVSSSMFLGRSELEIFYSDYRVILQ